MRARHPSGRPIRREAPRRRIVWRVPDEGPVTPRLKTPTIKTEAVGFWHFEHSENSDAEDE